ncbi:TetR/AcrR family transcriptional regulator [Pseudoduganella danionis]|uniref:TetR/AcrR family transcriptional regulator n=1 Tax=Pseudoduganella danionis TaxID=1890295 RepID=UPI0035B17A06
MSAYSIIFIPMARPRSDDKRLTILRAATGLFAEEGLNAPTARIAKAAGVAEGTIFTYFANKDVLLNELYLALKGELRAALAALPASASLKEQVWLAWRSYVHWGVSNPQQHQTLARLAMSPQITADTLAQGNRAFCDVSSLLEQAMRAGPLGQQSVEFAGAMMGAMGDVTMTFVRARPEAAASICQDGFAAFWHALSGA